MRSQRSSRGLAELNFGNCLRTNNFGRSWWCHPEGMRTPQNSGLLLGAGSGQLPSAILILNGRSGPSRSTKASTQEHAQVLGIWVLDLAVLYVVHRIGRNPSARPRRQIKNQGGHCSSKTMTLACTDNIGGNDWEGPALSCCQPRCCETFSIVSCLMRALRH